MQPTPDGLRQVLRRLGHIHLCADSEAAVCRKANVLNDHGRGGWVRLGGIVLDRGLYRATLVRWDLGRVADIGMP